MPHRPWTIVHGAPSPIAMEPRNQACVNHPCGSCTTDADCHAPLSCIMRVSRII